MAASEIEIIEAYINWMRTEAPRHYSANTIRTRRSVLYQFARQSPGGMARVTRQDVTNFLYRTVRATDVDLRSSSTKAYFVHLRQFTQWASNPTDPWWSADPMRTMRPPGGGSWSPKPVDLAVALRALAALPEPFRTAAVLALHAGLRCSEIAALDRKDITEEFVTVRCGKGRKSRDVDTLAVLWEWVRDRPAGPLVRHPITGARVTGGWLSRAQRDHWAAVGHPEIHWHRLRHTYATELLDDGVDLLVVSELMGHSTVATTQTYIRVKPTQRRAAAAALSARMTAAAAQAAQKDAAA